MKLRNMIVVLVALTVAGTVVVVRTDGVGRTLDAITSFFAHFGVDAAFAGDQGAGERVATQSATDFRWSGRLGSGESLEIKGVNGSVDVVRADGDEIVVMTDAHARRSDPASVHIERVEHADGITFCAVYPTPEGKPENLCRPGSGGRMSTEHNDVQVDFRVEVPDGVSFVGRTVNGHVRADGIDGDVIAVTVNGDIEIATSGLAQAETVNGSIEASIGSPSLADGTAFTTVNGSITLDLPDDVDAELDASWLNGSFESDLPFLLEGRVSRRSAHGMLGDGGPELELETVNGSIRIR